MVEQFVCFCGEEAYEAIKRQYPSNKASFPPLTGIPIILLKSFPPRYFKVVTADHPLAKAFDGELP